MDKDERKRLKKLGKERIEKRSQEIHAALAASNPAPIGSDEWVANYRQAHFQERDLRTAPPDYIPPSVAQRDWVTLPVDDTSASAVLPIPTIYLHCQRCKALLHSATCSALRCECGNIQFQPDKQAIFVNDRASIRLVRLLARATKKSFWSRFCWRFFKSSNPDR